MASIILNKIGKVYRSSSGDGKLVIPVIKDLTLEIKEGEFVAVFGPNGCGKTTLLNLISGIAQPDTGSIQFDRATGEKGSVGYIFQNYWETLLPWRSVINNISYPLEVQGVSRVECEQRSKGILDEFKISLPPDAWPHELSGGQQQLLAIARALVANPDVVLFDEPFASLDYSARVEMRAKIEEVWKRTSVTTIFVSHDLDEALLVADRLVVLSRRPASVQDILAIPFPRPRNQALAATDEFLSIRATALKSFVRSLTP